MNAVTIHTVSAKPGVGLRNMISDTLVMVRRNLTMLVRLPQLLVFSLVQPMLFVFMFRYVFGGAINSGTAGMPYVDFLMPGIFLQTASFGGAQQWLGRARIGKPIIVVAFSEARSDRQGRIAVNQRRLCVAKIVVGDGSVKE